MFQTIKKSFQRLSNYPRLRVLLIVIGVIIAFIILMNLLRPTPHSNTPNLPSSVQPATPGNSPAKAAPANQVTEYQTLAQTSEAQAEKQAESQGDTVFQNAFQAQKKPSNPSNASNPPPLNQNSNTTLTPTSPAQMAQLQQQLVEAQKAQAAQQAAAQAQAQAAAQAKEQAEQQQQAAIMQDEMSAMRTGLQNVSGSWKIPTQALTVGSNTGGNAPSALGKGPVAIKAGSILFAVIDTSLNSDQPGTPVLATIVTGPYKGAKLLGGFTLAGKALVVQFNTMSLRSLGSSIGINAYAIDEKTADNSLATSVNNHYLLRYGMLFASAFLQGFGNAYQNYTYNCPPGTQNCSVVNTNSSGVTTQNNEVTTSEAFYQGLGQVGTNLGQAAASEFNTPPTVRVAQGTGVGILFMSDVSLPLNSN